MEHNFFKYIKILLLILITLLMACSSSDSPSNTPMEPIIVNSIEDISNPAGDTVTLRSALASAASGQSIEFDESLDGATMELSIIGEEHTTLKGEIMGMRDEPSGPVSYLVGYFDRDYGKSALYAQGRETEFVIQL